MDSFLSMNLVIVLNMNRPEISLGFDDSSAWNAILRHMLMFVCIHDPFVFIRKRKQYLAFVTFYHMQDTSLVPIFF